MGTDSGLFRLLQLASPTLPVGSFAWSQGLEAAVDRGLISNEKDAELWIKGLLNHGLGRLDIPVLLRMHTAWKTQDKETVTYWNDRLYASRGSREFQAEDTQMGQALARLLVNLNIIDPDRVSFTRPTYAALFSLAGVLWDLCAQDTAAAYLWSFVENQVIAAVKLVPLGQSAGQTILMNLCPTLPSTWEKALTLDDEDIGSVMPGLTLASCFHETQHSRLYRS